MPLSPVFVQALGNARERSGVLLVADEVATGFGRTGPLFASESWSFAPDVLITSKGLTNGTVAAAAVLLGPRLVGAFEHHDAILSHAETQAGTPASCAAMSATIAQFEETDVLAHGLRVGRTLERELARLVADHPRVIATTGSGCFRSIRVIDARGEVLNGRAVTRLVSDARGHGAVVHPGPGGVQFIPALVSGDDDIRELVAAVRAALDMPGDLS